MKLAVTFIAVFVAADVVTSKFCTTNEDCRTIADSSCQNYECKCTTYHHMSRDGKKCIPNSIFYGRCDPSEETCHVNMKCRKDSICVCDNGHRYDWGMEARCLYEQTYGKLCSKHTMVCGTYGSNMRCHNDVCKCRKDFHYDNDMKRCRRCNIPVNIGDQCNSERKCCAKGSQCVKGRCRCVFGDIYMGLEDRCISGIGEVICGYLSQGHEISLPNKDMPFLDGNRECDMLQVNVTLNKVTSPCRSPSPIVTGGNYSFETDPETFITGKVNFLKRCTKDGREEPMTSGDVTFRLSKIELIVYNYDIPTCPLATFHIGELHDREDTEAKKIALRETKYYLEQELQEIVPPKVYPTLENGMMSYLDCKHRRPTPL